MASERFLKLDKEKQERILKAARAEFARVPFEEVSINQIIKNAGISRGSFYTYFEDKEELLADIYEQQDRGMESSLRNKLLEQKGDIWKMAGQWTREILGYKDSPFVKEILQILTHTTMKQRNYCLSGSAGELKKKERDQRQFEWLMQNVDPGVLDMNRPREELEAVYRMVTQASVMTLAYVFTHPEEEERCLRELDMELEILRRGINFRMEEQSKSKESKENKNRKTGEETA